MSSYEIGAFDALEWAWYMLRRFRENPAGVDEARRVITEVLSDMGKGNEVNFKEMPDRRQPLDFNQVLITRD